MPPIIATASGQAKVADNDPYFHAARTLVPVWSPDSKWIVYPKHLKSLYRALYVYNVDTGEKRQITDGHLGQLNGMPHLRQLRLQSFGVTDTGMERFRKDNPNVKVTR